MISESPGTGRWEATGGHSPVTGTLAMVGLVCMQTDTLALWKQGITSVYLGWGRKWRAFWESLSLLQQWWKFHISNVWLMSLDHSKGEGSKPFLTYSRKETRERSLGHTHFCRPQVCVWPASETVPVMECEVTQQVTPDILRWMLKCSMERSSDCQETKDTLILFSGPEDLWEGMHLDKKEIVSEDSLHHHCNSEELETCP